MKAVFTSLAALSFLASTPGLAQDAPVAPRNTPGLPAELVPIDDLLTGGLLNDPTSLSWDAYGVTRELVQDASYPGGGAANRVSIGPSANVYDGGLNIPLLAPVRAQEQLTIGFFARTISSEAEDGKGRVQVRFQINQPPYAGFGEEVVVIDTEWDFYEVTAPADRAMRRDGIVTIQFGLEAQTVEIGQAIVVSGTRSVLD